MPDNANFEQFAPHYNIKNNKIGICIFENDDNSKIKYPELKSDSENNKPTAFISVHELPKLLTYVLLEKDKDKGIRKSEELISDFIEDTNSKLLDIEMINEIRAEVRYEPKEITRKLIDTTKYLTDYALKSLHEKEIDYQNRIKDRREILQKILDKKGLKLNQMPSVVTEYMMKIVEPKEDKIFHYSKRLHKQEIKSRLKKLDRQIENNDKIKLGELATFLARDIINMVVKKEVKQKITSPYYNKLQNKIAFFSLNKNSIIELCDQELGLFNKNIGHVFLTERLINRSNTLIDFYKDYLNVKKEWLAGQNFKNRTLPLIFEKYKNKRNINFEKYLERKLVAPVNLPTSLFNEELKDLIIQNSYKKGLRPDRNEKGINKLLAFYLQNDTQPFYNYTREYLIKVSKDQEPKEISFEPNTLSDKELKTKLNKYVMKNEKQIRFIQTKDRVLRLMCEGIIKKGENLGLKNDILLKNTHPTSEVNILDIPVNFSKKTGIEEFTIIGRDTDNWKEQVEKWNNLTKEQKQRWLNLSEDDKQKTNETKKAWYQWTIKDFGRFSKVIHDRRLSGLLPYFATKEIPLSLIEYEIAEYNKFREYIFDNIFAIEEAIINKDKVGLLQIAKHGKHNEIQFDKYLEWLDKKEIEYDKDVIKGFIKEIRNKFSHTQFPVFAKTGINKIAKEKVLEFEQYHTTKRYKGYAYTSIVSQIYEIYDAKIKQKNT